MLSYDPLQHTDTYTSKEIQHFVTQTVKISNTMKQKVLKLYFKQHFKIKIQA